MNVIRKLIRRRGLLPAGTLAALLTLAPLAAAGETFTEIDVTIDIYNNAGISKADAKKAIAEASKILKQAKIKLNTADSRTKDGQTKGDDGSGGGTANDGKFNKEERKKIREEGGKEVNGGRKGIKVVFAQVPETEHLNNPGISVHRNPTVIVKKRANTQQTAESIAHEILHALTLSERHTIDATTQSNDNGHAPNKPGKLGRGNIMAPSTFREGTAISDPQTKKVKDDGVSDTWGSNKNKATKATPGQKDKQQKGAAQDDRKDQASSAAPGYLDLSRTVLHSTFDTSALRALIELDELFPAAGNVDSRYSVLFETDTGHAGADREVRLRVQGDAAVAPLSISGTAIDLVGGTSTPLTNVAILEAVNGLDIDVPAIPELNQLSFEVDKSLLGLQGSLDNISVDIEAFDLTSPLASPPLVDSMQLGLDLGWWERQPDLVTAQGQAIVGGDVFFDIAGLTPMDNFDFFLDEALVFSGALDASGGFSGNVVLPSFSPDEGFFYLTAIDSAGNAAFNVIDVTPEPGTLVLVLIGVLGVRWGRYCAAVGRVKKIVIRS